MKRLGLLIVLPFFLLLETFYGFFLGGVTGFYNAGKVWIHEWNKA